MNSRGRVTLDYCWDLCKEKIININVMVVVAPFFCFVICIDTLLWAIHAKRQKCFVNEIQILGAR